MEYNREAIEAEILEHARAIYKIVAENTKSGYLDISIFANSGSIGFNNEYYSADKQTQINFFSKAEPTYGTT